VRWYLRFGLSYGDLEEILAETGDRGGSRRAVALGATLHALAGRRGPAGPPYDHQRLVRRRNVKVTGAWPDVHPAVDQHGQVVDVSRTRGAI
jgi:transposase-like protein